MLGICQQKYFYICLQEERKKERAEEEKRLAVQRKEEEARRKIEEVVSILLSSHLFTFVKYLQWPLRHKGRECHSLCMNCKWHAMSDIMDVTW